MELTKDILQADREVLVAQVTRLQAQISYLDGLLAYMAREEDGLDENPQTEPLEDFVPEPDEGDTGNAGDSYEDAA